MKVCTIGILKEEVGFFCSLQRIATLIAFLFVKEEGGRVACGYGLEVIVAYQPEDSKRDLKEDCRAASDLAGVS